MIGSARDVGVTVGFELTGSSPFTIEYTEKRNKARASTKTARFSGYNGEVILQPENEGEYTYVRHAQRVYNTRRCSDPLLTLAL